MARQTVKPQTPKAQKAKAPKKKKPKKLRSRRGNLTREGRVLVFVTIGVGVAAVNTGNNLLYMMLGLMLSLLLISMVLSEIALWRVAVKRHLPQRLFANAPMSIDLRAANNKRRMPSYSLEIEDRAEDQVTDRRCYFLKIAAQGDQKATYRRTVRKRGRLTLTGYTVVTRYPFGLAQKERYIKDPLEVVVYPELVVVSSSELSSLTSGVERPSGHAGAGIEVGGLRDYRSGDDARRIHWKRTAFLQTMVVKERMRDRSSELTLVVDNARQPIEGWDEAFEVAVSKAASMAAEAVRRGSSVRIVARGSASSTVKPNASLDPVWHFLALLEAVDVTESKEISIGTESNHVVPVKLGPQPARAGPE